METPQARKLRRALDTIQAELRNNRVDDSTPDALAERYGELKNPPTGLDNPADRIDAAFASLPAMVPSGMGGGAKPGRLPIEGIAAAGILPMGRRLVRLSPQPTLEAEPGRHGYLYFTGNPRAARIAAVNNPKFINFFKNTESLNIMHPKDTDITGRTIKDRIIAELLRQNVSSEYINEESRVNDILPMGWPTVENPAIRRMLADEGYHGSLVSDEAGTSLALLPSAFNKLRQTGSGRLDALKPRRDAHYTIGDPYLKNRHDPESSIIDVRPRQNSIKLLNDILDEVYNRKMVSVKRYRDYKNMELDPDNYPPYFAPTGKVRLLNESK